MSRRHPRYSASIWINTAATDEDRKRVGSSLPTVTEENIISKGTDSRNSPKIQSDT